MNRTHSVSIIVTLACGVGMRRTARPAEGARGRARGLHARQARIAAAARSDRRARGRHRAAAGRTGLDRSQPDDPSPVDIAIAADRKALIAQAEAPPSRRNRTPQATNAQLQSIRASQLQSAAGQLDQSQQALGRDADAAGAAAGDRRGPAAEAADLEAKLKDARDTIAKIAAVKDDDRGMVITLQGEVLFKTGK